MNGLPSSNRTSEWDYPIRNPSGKRTNTSHPMQEFARRYLLDEHDRLLVEFRRLSQAWALLVPVTDRAALLRHRKRLREFRCLLANHRMGHRFASNGHV